jgi:hypothetical protein
MIRLRLKATYVPSDVVFATKPQLAVRMIERVIATAVPFQWVAATRSMVSPMLSGTYADPARATCSVSMPPVSFGPGGKPRAIAGTAAEIAKALGASDWQRLSAASGTKGPRLHDWYYLELADLGVEEFNDENHGLWTRGLLIRRNIADGDLAYFSTWCPAGTPIEILVRVECHRGRSRTVSTLPERVRSRPQRDQILAWLASPCLARHACLRHDGGDPAPGKQVAAQKNTPLHLIRWSIQEIRRVAHRLARRRIDPSYVIAWSLWRRAHQAAAQQSHLKRKFQL